MIFQTSTRHPHVPGSRLVPGYALHGLQGSPAIEQMQRALSGLAQATRSSAVNVTVTGVVDIPTIGAVSTALGWALDRLPSGTVPGALKDVIRIAPLMAVQTDLRAVAVSLITQNANVITNAAKALAAMYATPASAPPLPPAAPPAPTAGTGPFGLKLPNIPKMSTAAPPPPPAEVPFYKNPKIMIPVAGGVVGVGVLALLLRR